jgi:hypothetical protein
LRAFRDVIFDPARCQASRAASPLLVSHSEPDWPRAGLIDITAHPKTKIDGKTRKRRMLLKPLLKDMKLTPLVEDWAYLNPRKWIRLA